VLVQHTEQAVTLVSEMVRNLSHALSPVMMSKVGFKTSLEKVVSIFNASGKIKIDLIVLGFEEYDVALNSHYTAFYGIIYELLNNVVKHSNAKNVLLQVTEHPDCFSLIAEDDGMGIDAQKMESNQHLGITGIRSKVEFFKGDIAFDINIPQGLIVTIQIPTPTNETQDNIS
jgi:signal transduction histidine kinase